MYRDCRNGLMPSSIVTLTECKQGEGLWVQDSVTRLNVQGRELAGTVFNLEQPFNLRC